MIIHWFQHHPDEGLGALAPLLWQQGHTLQAIRWWAGETCGADDIQHGLIVMGGPMNVDEHELYPWLSTEKSVITEVMHRNTPILGVCLGAQLLARCMGAKVFKNPQKEIGWWPVSVVSEVGLVMQKSFTTFHWHGDTFELPAQAKPLFASAACAQQGFMSANGKVIGLQFHPEMGAAEVQSMALAFDAELAQELARGNPWVQTAAEIQQRVTQYAADNRRLCAQILARLF